MEKHKKLYALKCSNQITIRHIRWFSYILLVRLFEFRIDEKDQYKLTNRAHGCPCSNSSYVSFLDELSKVKYMKLHCQLAIGSPKLKLPDISSRPLVN
jgi:hypothetical protein